MRGMILYDIGGQEGRKTGQREVSGGSIGARVLVCEQLNRGQEAGAKASKGSLAWVFVFKPCRGTKGQRPKYCVL